MYEIGDDMVLLGASKDRLDLVENEDLLNMAKVGKVSTPIDLMDYDSADEQPSIFFLRESPHQSILTIFNWSKTPRSHSLKLADLGLPADHSFVASDVLNRNESVPLVLGVVTIENQMPESVRVIKITDTNVQASPPKVTLRIPSEGNAGETLAVSAFADPAGTPPVGFLWDFGDGTTATSSSTTHTYSTAGEYTIQLKVQGVDGITSAQSTTVKIRGEIRTFPNLRDNRRFREPND
jgi:hypothetical protein